jgi:hypothetical protein
MRWGHNSQSSDIIIHHQSHTISQSFYQCVLNAFLFNCHITNGDRNLQLWQNMNNSFKGLFKNKSNKISTKKDCMLGFPGSSAIMGFEDDFESPPIGKAKQRNSICLNGANLLAGLSDYDSDADLIQNKDAHHASSTNNNTSNPSNPNSSGGPEHRPLVGGFAAAAYEAARVDYYKKQGLKVNGHDNAEKNKPKFPIFRNTNLPSYP